MLKGYLFTLRTVHIMILKELLRPLFVMNAAVALLPVGRDYSYMNIGP